MRFVILYSRNGIEWCDIDGDVDVDDEKIQVHRPGLGVTERVTWSKSSPGGRFSGGGSESRADMELRVRPFFKVSHEVDCEFEVQVCNEFWMMSVGREVQETIETDINIPFEMCVMLMVMMMARSTTVQAKH
ncbi:Hemicentin-1 [Manis pentadactyla]|nr:Hemicentin-1 [Manis pentadactyla]